MTDRTLEAMTERIRQARALTRAGYSANEIGIRLGVSNRTVVRYRAGAVGVGPGRKKSSDTTKRTGTETA